MTPIWLHGSRRSTGTLTVASLESYHKVNDWGSQRLTIAAHDNVPSITESPRMHAGSNYLGARQLSEGN